MNLCERVQAREIQLYLDNELAPPEHLELEIHLLDCCRCRTAFEGLRAVVDVVRGSQPLYDVPEGSRQRARRLVARHEAQSYRFAAAATAAAVAIAIATFALSLSSGLATAFSAYAAASHLRYANGAMPLDVESSDPETISGWLRARTPLHLRLPDSDSALVTPKRYRLKGARLLQYRNRDVAFLAYEMDRKPVSLLMTSDPVAVPSSGTVYRSGALTFRFSDIEGLRLIAWTDRGIHYSLVSESGGRGAESCIICHGRSGERRLIDDLKPHE
jgi:anti-sigma factor RsiW